jgi:hypothetical protein
MSVFGGDRRHAIRINDECTVDVMPGIAGLTWDEMQPHITATEIDGVPIRLLELAGLLKAARGTLLKDPMAAAVIEAARKAAQEPG